MKITYKKLWKLLIDRGLNKSDLKFKAGISSSSIAKLGHNQNVNTDLLVKICNSLNCRLDEIMELEEENDEI